MAITSSVRYHSTKKPNITICVMSFVCRVISRLTALSFTFGLPCIGRDCYEMPYFIQDGETGLILKHDDPHELTSLMLRILHDDNFSQNVAANHDHYLHDYSWGAVARRIAKVID